MSYAMPQTGVMQESFSGAPPVMSLPRKWTYRVFIILGFLVLVLPALLGGVLMVAGGLSGAKEGMAGAMVGAAISTGIGMLLGLLFVWLFLREMKRSAALYEQGIEQRKGGKVLSIRWPEISELYIQAMLVRAGGLVGMAAGAIADRMKKDQPLPESANVVVTVKSGDGKVIKLTSQDKGVIQAYQEACRRVNSRLVDAAVKTVQNGGQAAFGKVTLSGSGVAFGNKPATAFAEITSLALDGGQVVAKKEGKWLKLGSQPVARTPNVYVLLAAYSRLASGGAVAGDASNVTVGRDVAGRQYVSG